MNKKELSGYCMWKGVHPQWVINADKCCCPQYHNPEDEEMTINELQELMDENENFIKNELPKVRADGMVLSITENSVMQEQSAKNLRL